MINYNVDHKKKLNRMATIASNDVKTNIHLSFSPEMPLFSITFSGDCILINFLSIQAIIYF